MISRLSSGRRRILTTVASICLLSWIPTAWSFAASNNNGSTRIQVCQNKDCVKNFPTKYDGGLTQLLQDLIPENNEGGISSSSPSSSGPGPAVVIEASGCLSKCNNGPNVCCRAGATETLYSKVDDILMAAAILEVGADVDSPGVLMAAIEDMAKASQSTNIGNKLESLSKAIQSLQKAGLDQTTAMAHALILRADAHIDSIPQNIDQALQDAMKAIEIDDLNGRAWRVIADAKEANGDVPGAIEAVSNWALKNPSFATKAKKEVARLSSGSRSSRNYNP